MGRKKSLERQLVGKSLAEVKKQIRDFEKQLMDDAIRQVGTMALTPTTCSCRQEIKMNESFKISFEDPDVDPELFDFQKDELWEIAVNNGLYEDDIEERDEFNISDLGIDPEEYYACELPELIDFDVEGETDGPMETEKVVQQEEKDPLSFFEELLGRSASSEERQILLKLQHQLKLRNDDALWLLFIPMQHHLALYKQIPEQIAMSGEHVMKCAIKALDVEATKQKTAFRQNVQQAQSKIKREMDAAFELAQKAAAETVATSVHDERVRYRKEIKNYYGKILMGVCLFAGAVIIGVLLGGYQSLGG